MNGPSALRSVLKAFSGDRAVDWDAAEASATADDVRSVLKELRVIERIALAHSSTSPATPSSVLPFRLAPGAQWGPLTVRELIGTGADGDVYRAHDDRLQRDVALKLLRRASPEANLAHTLNEARLLARVRHPNVVTVFGADVIDDVAGVWMEIVNGETLQSVVSRQGPFAADEAARIGSEICDGLAAIHDAGVIHRDVKAQNVMRESGGRIVVMDFSASAASDAGTGLAGTPFYLAPELLSGQRASELSDVYSVGVLLYFMVTGAYPVVGQSIADIARAHQEGRRKSLRAVRPDLPGAFINTAERALSIAPSERPGSARELATLLSPPRRWRPTVPWVAAAIAVIALLSTAIAFQVRQSRREIAFSQATIEARPWVLVAAFDNRSADSSFDSVLEYALERELIASTEFRIVSRPRIDDTLRLMRQPIDTVVDQAKAREVALRDGEIKHVIAGRVDRVGGVAVLSASVLDVNTGAALAAVSEQVSDPGNVARAMRRLADRLREALGEAPAAIQQSARQLERVTTPSLQALRLYTESYAAAERDHWGAAMPLAARAVEADPSFATAHTWLAWTMMRNGLARETYLAAAAKAVELAGSASDWEQLWIEGSAASLGGDEERAMAAYAALLRLYPDHLWATNNLSQLYVRHGRAAEALALALRLAELRPHDYDALYMALDRLQFSGNLEEAANYARRIRESGVHDRDPSGDAWIFEATLAWHHNDPRAAIMRLNAVQAEAVPLDRELHDAVLRRAAMAWLALGRPADARQALQLALPDSDSHLILATIAHEAGDLAEARSETLAARVGQTWAAGPGNTALVRWALATWLFNRVGASIEARDLLAAAAPTQAANAEIVTIMKAQVAAVEGHRGDAIRQMEPLRWDRVPPRPLFQGKEVLADALVHETDLGGAVNQLRGTTALKHRALYDPAIWWMRCQVRLAEIYQQLGNQSEAQAIARELEVMLSEAEPGFPLAERVQALLAQKR